MKWIEISSNSYNIKYVEFTTLYIDRNGIFIQSSVIKFLF